MKILAIRPSRSYYAPTKERVIVCEYDDTSQVTHQNVVFRCSDYDEAVAYLASRGFNKQLPKYFARVWQYVHDDEPVMKDPQKFAEWAYEQSKGLLNNMTASDYFAALMHDYHNYFDSDFNNKAQEAFNNFLAQ